MYKLLFVVALSISAVYAQEAVPAGGEAAPEPYSYGYETDTHAAAEQRDPSGKVTGYYTLADADGRSRRVEYYADETGFHAKVQTNEVGTKSENSADVEVLAAPPTQEQFIYRQQEQQVVQVPAQQRVVTQQVVSQAPKTTAAVAYTQQPGYAYTQGYSYAPGSYYASYNPGYYGYGAYYQPGQQYYGYGAGYGAAYGGYNSYNNHLPSQYYRTVNTLQAPIVRSGYYQSSQVSSAPVSTGSVSYRSVNVPATGAVSYQTVGAPAVSGVTYQTVGAPAASVSYQSSGVPSTVGSGNYVLLKKRESETAAAAETAEEKKEQ